jgi:hypothetical protein
VIDENSAVHRSDRTDGTDFQASAAITGMGSAMETTTFVESDKLGLLELTAHLRQFRHRFIESGGTWPGCVVPYRQTTSYKGGNRLKIEDKIKDSTVFKPFGQGPLSPSYSHLCGKSTEGTGNGYSLCMKKFDSAESGRRSVRECASRYYQGAGQPVIAKSLPACHGALFVRINNQSSSF